MNLSITNAEGASRGKRRINLSFFKYKCSSNNAGGKSMFIYTIKASSIKFFAVLLVSVAALVTLIALIPEADAVGEVAVVATDYSNIKTNDDRIGFITRFGYHVNAENYESEKVIIPEKFDAAYTEYNDIQRAQGLNLKAYRGKAVTRFSYYVNNYPGYDGKVMITLLVYKNRVVGGDVTGMEGEGFVHGFEKP